MIFVLQTLHASMFSLLRAHLLVVIVGIIFFEELGVPSPIPGDLMMVLAGVLGCQVHTWLAASTAPAALSFYARVSLPADALLSLIALAILVFVVRKLKRVAPTFTRDRHAAATAALVAGVMAGVVGLLGADSVSGFIS